MVALSSIWRGFDTAAVFGASTLLTVAVLPSAIAVPRTIAFGIGWRAIGGAMAGFALLACTVLASKNLRMRSAGLIIGGIYVSAYAEELVFRRWLPWRLRRSTIGTGYRCREVIVQVVAQATFAGAHFSRAADFNWPEALRFFAAGLLLAGLALGIGVWFSSALHAFVNLRLMMPRSQVLLRPSIASLAAATVAGLVVLTCWSYRNDVVPVSRECPHEDRGFSNPGANV